MFCGKKVTKLPDLTVCTPESGRCHSMYLWSHPSLVPSVGADKWVKGKKKILEKEVNISPRLLPNEEDGGEGWGGALLRPGNSAIYLQKHSAERLKILYHKMHNF
jgi:hypothetical protein